jgi:ferredoxin
MQATRISKGKIAEFIHELMQDSQVIAPVSVAGQVRFKPIGSPAEVEWDYHNPTVPPTEHILPHSETMFQFEQRGTDFSVSYNIDNINRTILGIRPCDVASLRMLDEVFKGKYEDPYYLSRRNHTTLIAMMCLEPGGSCFCSSFGTGPGLDAESGADLLMVDLGDAFFVQVFTERGQTIMERVAAMGSPATSADRERVEAIEAETRQKIHRTLDLEGLPEAMGQLFDSAYWDKISRKCLACGACTYLCPVCYCFDVFDTCSQAQGERVRCWDACTFKSFALLSGGHNPRPSIKESYRQKMYHKFKFAVERHGYALCVGCGRCLDACPVDMDIVKVLSDAKSQVAEVI